MPSPQGAPSVATTLLLALTFSTGVIDAVGFLGLDRIFAGNMTGNVVILGMGLTGTSQLPVAGPAVALGAFIAGAATGGRVLRASVIGWSRRTTGLLIAVTIVLTAAAVVVLVAGGGGSRADHAPGHLPAMVVTALLALAMGAQAAAARHVKVADVTTVVVTSTITGLAADSWFGHRADQPWLRRATAIGLVCAGALAGALLLRGHLALGIVVSAVITAVVAIVGHIRAIGGTPQ